MDRTNSLSLTDISPDHVSGISNYVIPVYSSKNPDEVVMNIWFFDSGDYECYGVKGYGCVPSDVIQWYRSKSKELESIQHGMKKGIVFLHIPPQEFMYGWNVYSGFVVNLSIIQVWEKRMKMFAVRH